MKIKLKQIGNLEKTILGICFLLFLILFSPTAVRAAFSCSSGDLNTTCNVNNTQTLADGETISGTGNLVIQNGGNLTAAAQQTFNINMAGNITIESGGQISGNINATSSNFTINNGSLINVDTKGFPVGSGTGAGGGGSCGGACSGGGAGYGGNGGSASWVGGSSYGSLTQPIDLGSGGGQVDSLGSGSGGGAIKLNTSGTLTINGTITTGGQSGSGWTDRVCAPRVPCNGRASGGGSGGSIYITTGTLAGSGIISANGGDGGRAIGWNGRRSVPVNGGGGAGGRIAIYYSTSTHSGSITVYGGSGTQKGSVGTIYVKNQTTSKEFRADICELKLSSSICSVKANIRVGLDLTLNGFDTFEVLSGYTLDVDASTTLSTGNVATTTISGTLSAGNTSTISFPLVTTLTVLGTLSAGNTSTISFPLVTTLTVSGTLSAGNTSTISFPLVTTLTVLGTLSTGNQSTLSFPSITNITISGTLSADRIDITLTNLTISPGGLIKVDNRGYAGGAWELDGSGSGPGIYGSRSAGSGGGYGGKGGNDTQGDGGGASYGFLNQAQPIDLGSGGGGNEMGSGGAGGGAIKLNVSGTLTVNGTITANGGDGSRNSNSLASWDAGGGSGGSIWLTAGTLDGTGTIRANGGSGDSHGGGGGGGRIAIYYSTSTHSGSITVYGGSGYQRGAVGTIYVKNQITSKEISGAEICGINLSLANSPCSINNNFRLSNNPTFSDYFVGAFEVLPGASLEIDTNIIFDTGNNITTATISGTLSAGNQSTLSFPSITNITISGTLSADRIDITLTNLTISPGGLIKVDAKGCAGGGSRAGSPCLGGGSYEDFSGAGGGYGGKGGNGERSPGGSSYGSLTGPTDFGAGGGGAGGRGNGGAGGGAIKLNVSGTLTVNGTITANGGNGTANTMKMRNWDCGGGSGGSIWLTAGTLDGTGTINANGGSGDNNGGGGGGGRIAIYYTTKNYTGTITTYGGSGRQYGGAGTIYQKAASQSYGDLLVDNNGNSGADTPITSNDAVNILEIKNKASLVVASHLTIHSTFLTLSGNLIVSTPANFSAPNLANLTIQNGALFTHLSNTDTKTNYIDLTVSAPNLVDLTIDSGGVIDVSGKGYAAGTGLGAGAGDYSGAGGAGFGGSGGSGSVAGGGSAYGSTTEPNDLGSGGGGSRGGSGGGLVKLNIPGTLTNNGSIIAGGSGGTSNVGGGGSGGSIYLTVGTLAGSGLIAANGGVGGTPRYVRYGGGGAGGRIAIYYTSSTFPVANIAAYGGGSVHQYGGAGTIYQKSQSQTYGDLLVDNNGNSGALTPVIDTTNTLDKLTIQGAGNLEISSGKTVNTTNFTLSTNGTFNTVGSMTASNLTVNGGTFYLNTNLSVNPARNIAFSGASDLVIANGATLTHDANTNSKTNFIDWNIGGELNLALGSSVNVDGKGYSPGNGISSGTGAGTGGGGHGGAGGAGESGTGGAVNGSTTAPVNLGSGGTGGAGGGYVKFIIGSAIVRGSISANGANGGANTGGGAGGTIWLSVSGSFSSGSGSISADGGDGAGQGGGGGGGRIAIYVPSCVAPGYTYVGTITADGGTGFNNGENGTIFVFCPPSLTIEARDESNNLIPDAGTTSAASVVALISTAAGSFPIQHHKIEYKESGAPTWTTAFDCWDNDLNGYCDSDVSKSTASFSVNIGSFVAGKTIQYRSQATDSMTPPSTATSSVKTFTVESSPASPNQPPTAAMSCYVQDCNGPGCSCNGAWLTYNGDGVFYWVNNTSTDPDNNIATSTWSIIGYQDPWTTCGTLNPLCNMGIMPRISAATYIIQLKVEDTGGLSDTSTTSIQVRQDTIADFECSPSGLNGTWLSCDSPSFKPSKGQIIYFKDDLAGPHKYSSPSEGGGPIISRTWEKDGVVFLGGNISFASTTLTQTHTSIRLTVKDSAAGGGRSDFQEYTISTKPPVADWKEIPPW